MAGLWLLHVGYVHLSCFRAVNVWFATFFNVSVTTYHISSNFLSRQDSQKQRQIGSKIVSY